MRLSLLIFLLFSLSGCAIFPGSNEISHLQHWYLDIPLEKPNFVSDGPSISVAMPRSPSLLDNTAIYYRQTPHRIEPYAHNLWSAAPAEMLQPLLINQLESSGFFSVVLAAPEAALSSPLRLETELLRLYQDYQQQPSQIVLALRAQLLDVGQQRVLGSQLFQIKLPTQTDDMQGGVTAMNQAIGQLLKQLRLFVIQHLTEAA
ncbi:ABC-type transport auxiliary lipoprotein family protein [Candidatus Venteria ishoeyi]|uniref:ABC-type transport auxiliary lipoprotein family protein n=1 Tax=Candidatus Venteria ishoeyi TaxID=1899563 RepID=UPI0025A5705D|nr:ABC-type transport auxiliary lipoprotein family protein [Candidatus Venteria ishoeyi]MDM8545567.1 ABC-type transport auxiliary lipoprotein family protein [Candidatus Venteria ishoeyi]